MLSEQEPTMQLSCVYFRISSGVIINECGFKNIYDGYKPCIKLGKPCRYLQGEFIVEK